MFNFAPPPESAYERWEVREQAGAVLLQFFRGGVVVNSIVMGSQAATDIGKALQAAGSAGDLVDWPDDLGDIGAPPEKPS